MCSTVTDTWYLKIDGVEGESTAVDHEQEIDVLSWSWGVSVPQAQQGTGGRTGRPQLADLRITTRISKASPKILAACATGQRLQSAVLSGVRPHGGRRSGVYLQYRLGDVTVTSVEHHDAEAELPTEVLSLAYGSVEVSYAPQDQTGRLGQPVEFRWDVRQNRVP